MQELISQFFNYMNSGGFVMWPLFAGNLLLWYGIGFRFHMLNRPNRGTVRTLIMKHEQKKDQKKIKGVLDQAIKDALELFGQHTASNRLGDFLDELIMQYEAKIKRYSTLVKTIVVIAPLTGLLGTVIGMIETFDSLKTMAMYTQGGGIAAGISQALFTTQLGLVVAVPGLILGRMLDKKESRLRLDFEQIKDVLLTKKETHAL